MIAVADTNALIWYIFDYSRLSALARAKFEQAYLQDEQIGFSAISFAEIIYLSERNRVPEDMLSDLLQVTNSSNPILVEIPFNRHVAQVMSLVERAQVPDLPDRIISATALRLDVPLITSDRKIRSSDVETLW